VDLRYVVGVPKVDIPLTPAISGDFAQGVWTGSVTLQRPATDVVLRADDGFGHIGLASEIDVTNAGGLELQLHLARQAIAFGGRRVSPLPHWKPPILSH
jgi:hypothetical protein